MKIKTTLLFILVLSIRCTHEPPPDVGELGGKIISIKFGSGWDSNSHQLTGVSTSFPIGSKIIYYEICFEKAFAAGGMIKKKWIRNNTQFLEVTSFIYKGAKRICGEIHYYDSNLPMDTGTYEIAVFCYSAKQEKYVEYPYDGVNRRFIIE